MTCNRPFYDILSSGDIFEWLSCVFSIDYLGRAGFGLFVLGIPFVGLYNWSESYTLPMIWLAIAAPTISAAFIPGTVARRIAGLLTAAVALLIIGLYIWFR